jgi:hypothetical protein
MPINFQRSNVSHCPPYINNEEVENVQEYRYLGTIIDCEFKFASNIDKLYKKMNSRMYFIIYLTRK